MCIGWWPPGTGHDSIVVNGNAALSPPQFALNPAAPQAPAPMVPFPGAGAGPVPQQFVVNPTAPPTPPTLSHTNSYFSSTSSSSSRLSSPSHYNLSALSSHTAPRPPPARSRASGAPTHSCSGTSRRLDYFTDNADAMRTERGSARRVGRRLREEAGRM
ncbi:hypothetical protein D9619_003826 [Psilocybe cf. subviscida]|uniref:Uncharacterized protein n=1 Tax=Psilocybe cf. subviscida TaxID=2480587 RepID=A0A8H5AWH1_9AGAR|nr:hypothetical protein D9619_003826 [Psilocybe cf. subviscida]